MDSQIWIIIHLGVCFLLLFSAFNTTAGIQVIVSNSVAKDKNLEWNGYTAASILYAVFATANWIAPSTVALLGTKVSMIIGASCYMVFIINFLFPFSWGLYAASAVCGLGAGVIWTAQGVYLTNNSTPENINRNSGIFWAIFQGSLLAGNIFVALKFQGQSLISESTRYVVFAVLTVTGAFGVGLMFLLKGNSSNHNNSSPTRTSPKEALYNSFALMRTEAMFYLFILFFYTGLQQSFYAGVYGTSVGNTLVFGKDASKFTPITGIFIGLGEIIGGGVFGLAGTYTASKGRDKVVVLGFMANAIAFITMYFNLPPEANTMQTMSNGIITSNIYLALFGGFLLGFGDACFITQIMAFLGTIYSNDSAPAFALFKFVQSVASAVGFFVSSYITIHHWLYTLVPAAAIGTLCFCVVEWKERLKASKLQGEESTPKVSLPTNRSSSQQVLSPSSSSEE